MGLIIKENDDLYVVKFYKDELKDVDIYNIEDVSSLFGDILVKLKDKYRVRGFCFIEVFVNECHGMIIEINNEEKYGCDIDIKIKFYIDTLFMNEIYECDIDKYDDCYLYEDKYYSTYKNISDSELIYRDAYKIVKYGIKIK